MSRLFHCRYDRAVRHLLLALLIALMPLRGWAGDAMATRMVAAAVVQQSPVAQAGGTHADTPGAPAHDHVLADPAGVQTVAPDCAGHGTAPASSSSDTSHCQSCVVCQACYSVALLLPVDAGDLSRIATVVPQSAAPSFNSAERALRLKPPIS